MKNDSEKVICVKFECEKRGWCIHGIFHEPMGNCFTRGSCGYCVEKVIVFGEREESEGIIVFDDSEK